MIVSDKTYTNLSNLTEEQREVVIKVYQQWFDESGLVQGMVYDDDLEVVGWMTYLHIYKEFDGGYKLFVDGDDDDLLNKQEVTYEEIAQDAFGTPIDSRIEYWYKVCDLLNKHTEDLELFDKVVGGSEDACIGDAALEILEEGLKLRQNKRKQEIEDAEYQAKKAEEEIVKSIIERWKWDFDELGYFISFHPPTKKFHIEYDCAETCKIYKADDQPEIRVIHSKLKALGRFH